MPLNGTRIWRPHIGLLGPMKIAIYAPISLNSVALNHRPRRDAGEREDFTMANTLLMPKATAVWLVDNTSLSFEQIAQFCGLHPLEVQGDRRRRSRRKASRAWTRS